MKTWEDIFEINRVERERKRDATNSPRWFRSFMGVTVEEKFQVSNKISGEVLGEYEDYVYARKQAKYRFKRMMKKVEKTLLLD